MRMLMTFFNELTTQSNTAFSFGTRFIVFRGRRTRRTRSDFIMDRFCTAGLPLEKKNITFERNMDKLFTIYFYHLPTYQTNY